MFPGCIWPGRSHVSRLYLTRKVPCFQVVSNQEGPMFPGCITKKGNISRSCVTRKLVCVQVLRFIGETSLCVCRCCASLVKPACVCAGVALHWWNQPGVPAATGLPPQHPGTTARSSECAGGDGCDGDGAAPDGDGAPLLQQAQGWLQVRGLLPSFPFVLVECGPLDSQ